MIQHGETTHVQKAPLTAEGSPIKLSSNTFLGFYSHHKLRVPHLLSKHSATEPHSQQASVILSSHPPTFHIVLQSFNEEKMN